MKIFSQYSFLKQIKKHGTVVSFKREKNILIDVLNRHIEQIGKELKINLKHPNSSKYIKEITYNTILSDELNSYLKKVKKLNF